jgi:alkanesulfonate monooxygenase SsuD/methylene tetrahydromethanopterin reductase-like flavin-dependent oxidoreductase (luciferase family)
VGGSGEKVTLKLVAKYGDACNITSLTAEGCRHKFDILRQHCENVGRDYDSIIKSAHVFMTLLAPGQDPEAGTERWRRGATLEDYKTRNFVGTPQESIEYFRSLEEAGVEYFVIYFRNDLTRFDTIQMFAQEVMQGMR